MKNTIRKQSNATSQLHFPGLSNTDKLKQNAKYAKSTAIHRFDPFSAGTYSQQIRDKNEAEPLDPRFLPEDIYAQILLQNINYQNTHSGRKRTTTLYDLSAKRKRQRLISLSSYDMLDEVLTKVADECVVDGTNGSSTPIAVDVDQIALQKAGVKDDIIEKIVTLANDAFYTMYNAYGFRDVGSTKSLYNKVYQFLVEGSLAYTFVYDNIEKPRKIIGAIEIDALDLQEFYKDGVKYWVQKRVFDNTKDDKILLFDSQIVRVAWQDTQNNSRFSYLEQIIRSFNNVRIMDETKIIWSVNNAQWRMMFEIPTKGLSRVKAATVLATEQQRFYDDVSYSGDSGELYTNGQPGMKMSKEYWMTAGDSGSPTITTVGDDGPDMSDPVLNDYFSKKFYRASRVPYSRFDAGASDSWNMDTQSQLREDITFGRFINRIRNVISYLFVKPVLLQLALDIPEIKNDPQILSAISVRYESYSIFEELMQMTLLSEKLDFVEKMRDSIKMTDPDGDDIPMFSMQYITEKYLPEITAEDLKLNKKYMQDERSEMFSYMKKKGKLAKELEKLADADERY